MSEAKDFLCRAFSDKDAENVQQLVETVFEDFLNGKYWEWKYKLNPNFDPSLVAVAEKNGRIIGCNHWLFRKLKLSGSVEAEAFLCADIVVSAQFRGRGIGKSLLLFLRRTGAIENTGSVLSYMFTDTNLGKRLYGPVAGYIPAPTNTILYFKLLSWSKLKNNLKAVNKKLKREKERLEKLSKLDLKVAFQISGAPPLLLELGKNGVKSSKRDFKNANITVISDLSTLAIFKRKKGRKRSLIKALLTRKLKIRGSLSDILKFYRSFWAIECVFSQKIS